MDEDIKMANGSAGSTTAVSFFGSDGAAGDFPVLKAFQEYIDAEQAKARKRMLGLSIFFVVLLVVVVVTFVMVLMFMIRQNQSLSDRLFDVAFKQHSAQQVSGPPVVVPVSAPAPAASAPVQRPTDDSVLKPFLEKIDKLAEALSNSVKAKGDAKAKSDAAQVPVAQPQPVVQQVPKELVSEEAKVREQLRRQREELMKLRDQTKAEKEKLRQEEVERNRRKLYPEYYAREDARKEAERRREEVPAVSYFDKSKDEDDDLAEVARLAKEAREKEAREKAAREKAAREKEAREKAAREKAAREMAAREKEAREKAAREKAAREKEAKLRADALAEAERIKAAAVAEAAKIRAAATKDAAATEAAAREKAAAAKEKAAAAEAAARKAAAVTEVAAKEKAAAAEAAKARVENIEVNTSGDSVVPLLISPVE